MLLSLGSLGLGVVLLYLGAEGLVRGSASIASRLGLSPLVIGLTVVAFGTSMPELVVSVDAALSGSASLAVGNVLGSNIGNVGLILGISALIFPLTVHARVVRVDLPIMVAVSALLPLLLRDGVVGRVEGAVLTTGLVLYIAFSLSAARHEPGQVQAEFAAGTPGASRSPAIDALLLVAGLAMLVFGARALVSGAVYLAEAAGMSEAAIGLTVVAIGTSLPELATSVVAALKGEGDIAVGNVVGSNLFNLLGIVGVASMVHPLSATGIGVLDFAVMLGSAALLLPLMRTGLRVTRWEGALLVGGYSAYLLHLLR